MQGIVDQELSIAGYLLHRLDRSRHGGGVLMYVSDLLMCKVLPTCVDLELLSIVLHNGCSKACISLFYRPPNSSPELFTSLYSCLESMNVSQFSNFILLGDFNIDFTNLPHTLLNRLIHIADMYALNQVGNY